MIPLQTMIDEIRDGVEQGILKNEMAERHTIVDRLLQGLGWPTSDKRFVVCRYMIGGGTVDYGLRNNQARPLAFIEVRNINEFDGDAAKRIFSAAVRWCVSVFVLTDGREWRFFYPLGSSDYSDCQVCALDINDRDSKTNANLLQRYLSYKSVQAGDAARAIENNYRLLLEVKHLPERK